MADLRYVSWGEFDGICRRLARRLASFDLDLVIGIARGGLPAAVHLAHLLEARYFGTVVRGNALLPGRGARLATLHLADWLSRRSTQAAAA